ncbi:Gag-Pro-Pol polyprotein [Labeo rohita]|uniref:ribonuclease H n=1 Tax=Labeo rohita TaxID=84645 RepID=A0ABQ8L4I3_LABRO|nr:Gag-Pro-Pol polyprotein [Labeo rohita]
MPFCPCLSGCSGFLSPSDGHDRCMLCLGCAHVEAVFVGGSCPHCENMTVGALRLRLSYILSKKRLRVTSDASHPGPPRAGTEAVVMGAEGDLGIAIEDNPPGTSSRPSHSPARSVPPVEFPGGFDSPPQGGLDFSFGAPEGDEISVAASEGGLSLSDAEGSTGLGFMAQSEAEAEIAAVLARAAESIGLEYVAPPSPKRSRLDDWFLGSERVDVPRSALVPFFLEVHEELTKSWKAPFSSRTCFAGASALTTLDGGAARGTWTSPRLSALSQCICARTALPPGMATHGSHPKHAASALHAMAILQVYQAKALKELDKGSTDPEVLRELRSATDYAFRATKVTAQALGRAMSTLVVQECHLWLNLAEMKDAEKSLEAWLSLPTLSRWLARTIRLGYAIQFARHPPKCSGILFTSVRGDSATVLRQEIANLLAKDAIEPVPPAEMKKGFYSPYFIQQDWFAAIDLKDAYFHVSILPRHRPFLRFAYEGRAYQYKVLPFRLSLLPRVFTKVAEAALAPLREQGIRILNYLDDWLILAQSQELVCEHRDQVLQHLARLGLRVNWEKSKLSPVQSISFLCVELDSVTMTARLSSDHAQSMLNCLNSFKHKTAVPLKLFQRLLGHFAPCPSRVLRWAWRHGTHRVAITPICCRLFSPWSDLAFLRAGVPLGQVSRRVVVTTDASKTRWGAVYNGHAVSGSWTGPRLQWHINCLELLTVLLALRRLRPLIQGKHVLVHIDNTVTVAYINRQGTLRSCRMSQLARHLLLWSLQHVKSLRAIHIPGHLNRVANALSRQVTFHGEWRLHPHMVQLIWNRFGEAQIDLFSSHESTHCALWYSLTEAPLGTDALAHSWPRGPRKYAFPPVSLIAQTLCKVREERHQVLMVAPYWPNQTWFTDLTLLASAPPWRIPLRKDLLSQGQGTIWHPRPDLWNLHVWSPAVIDTITQARAPSTRQLYALKWHVFTRWCASRGEDPQRCGLGAVLSFLQQGLEKRLSASTLKVYVAAVAANHDLVDGRSLGKHDLIRKHDLIIRFLRGTRRINPPRPRLIPSWDLSVVLLGLQREPFEPLQSVELGALSMKTALLIALTFLKREGDLQALSVCDECLEFGPAYSHFVLRPRPGYVPKVPTTPFRDQVVNLQAFPSEGGNPALSLLCPVRALRVYLERTQSFRQSEQVFVCFGGQRKGKAVSKQRLAHWIVDVFLRAYQAQDVPCQLSVRAHSTRGIVASSSTRCITSRHL